MFERLHAQAAKVYARKPKPGAGTAPFYTKPSATEQAAKRQRTDEASASGAQPNLPPDAGKNKTFHSLLQLFFFPRFSFNPGTGSGSTLLPTILTYLQVQINFSLKKTWIFLLFSPRS